MYKFLHPSVLLSTRLELDQTFSNALLHAAMHFIIALLFLEMCNNALLLKSSNGVMHYCKNLENNAH